MDKTGRAPAKVLQCMAVFTWAQWVVPKAAYLHDEGMHAVALPMHVELSKDHCMGCWPSHCEEKNSHIALRQGMVKTLSQFTTVNANCALGVAQCHTHPWRGSGWVWSTGAGSWRMPKSAFWAALGSQKSHNEAWMTSLHHQMGKK